jgi:hypothetical protein
MILLAVYCWLIYGFVYTKILLYKKNKDIDNSNNKPAAKTDVWLKVEELGK